ncbi:MAG: DUF3825 domain-containing protein [Pseudomonadota bacterium]
MSFQREDLLAALGEPFTNEVVARLRRLAHIPQGIFTELSEAALSENWGTDNYVLEKYLAVHIAWSIEQGRFTASSNQLFVAAGHLQTRYGTPLYIVFERNTNVGRQPLYCVHVGSDISAGDLPPPPDLPAVPELPRGAEIVMLHDHILRDNADRVPFLGKTPPVSQMCAVSGAIQWSINRGLQLPYWYYGRMNYLVPLYMQSRENITQAPDLIAPIQVNPDTLIVRTVLLPHMPYANSRVSVKRHDQLPHWMLDAWNTTSASITAQQIDDPEPSQNAR